MSTKDHKFCSKQISPDCIKSGPPECFALGRVCKKCHNKNQLQYYYSNKEIAIARPDNTYMTPLAQRTRSKARYQRLHPNVKKQIRLAAEVPALNKVLNVKEVKELIDIGERTLEEVIAADNTPQIKQPVTPK